MALTKAEREQKRIEEAELTRRFRAGEFTPSYDDTAICRRHPEVRLDRSAGQPMPAYPAGMCHECAAEELARREPPEDRQPPRRIDPGSGGRRLDLAYGLHRDMHGPRPMESGSYEEENALQQIEAAREAEEVREAEKHRSHLRGAILVSARPEGGRWMETYRVGRRYVKVGPG